MAKTGREKIEAMSEAEFREYSKQLTAASAELEGQYAQDIRLRNMAASGVVSPEGIADARKSLQDQRAGLTRAIMLEDPQPSSDNDEG